jgi:hypothetical protein
MRDIFSTSYTVEQCGFITSLVRMIQPTTALEIGTQQGNSAVAIALGMGKGSVFKTYDLFEPKYPIAPHGETHADMALSIMNLQWYGPECDWEVVQGDHLTADQDPAFRNGIDFLHIDVCNHLDNVSPILDTLLCRVKKMVVMEGGIENRWMRDYGFKQWLSYFDNEWMSQSYQWVTIPFNQHNAITLIQMR